MKIFIDIGHGGTDPGAVANKLIEKNLNLTVGLEVKQLLLKHGFEVKVSRETDIALSLTERCNMANQWGANIFVSIHHNAGGGDGYEVIHSITAGKGKQLAELIGKEFNKLGQNCRRVFSRESTNYPGQDYYTVINSTKMPAIITEYAFLDTVDSQAVDTIEELKAEAVAIVKGICSYVNVVYVEANKPPVPVKTKPSNESIKTTLTNALNELQSVVDKINKIIKENYNY